MTFMKRKLTLTFTDNEIDMLIDTFSLAVAVHSRLDLGHTPKAAWTKAMLEGLNGKAAVLELQQVMVSLGWSLDKDGVLFKRQVRAYERQGHVHELEDRLTLELVAHQGKVTAHRHVRWWDTEDAPPEEHESEPGDLFCWVGDDSAKVAVEWTDACVGLLP